MPCAGGVFPSKTPMKPQFWLLGAALLPLAPLSAAPALPAGRVASKIAPTPLSSPFARPLQGDKRYAHVLSRLAFGPRPGDIEALKKIGIPAYIESQMAPQSIDDAAIEAKLGGFNWLSAPSDRLMLAYESDKAGFIKKFKKAENGKIQPIQLNRQQKNVMARIEAAQIPERASVEAMGQLSLDKLARAVDSRRQLQEVLVDFWGNHFNVDVKKGPVRALKIRDDREAIRPRIFGTFRELLGASAHSPAMMVYLDNARSTREFDAGRRQKAGAKAKKRGGLNENYARELMELHTLGVEGGYSQADVTEVARCFTGWSIDQRSGEFAFRERAHDDEAKTVLGQTIPAGGGQSDGDRVLDLLAGSPATAKFIARKLCVRFVADNPPDALVSKVAGVFTRSNGDLSAVYRAIFASPEFLSEGAYRSKIKSPLEFTTSAARALGGTIDLDSFGAGFRLLATGGASLNQGNNGNKNKALAKLPKRPLAVEIANMGQPLFACQPPTGYAENSSKWVSSSALVSRLNFALSLTQGRIGDIALGEDTFAPAPLDEMAKSLLSADISPATRALIETETLKTPGDGARLRALIIGSPEFQRR